MDSCLWNRAIFYMKWSVGQILCRIIPVQLPVKSEKNLMYIITKGRYYYDFHMEIIVLPCYLVIIAGQSYTELPLILSQTNDLWYILLYLELY